MIEEDWACSVVLGFLFDRWRERDIEEGKEEWIGVACKTVLLTRTQSISQLNILLLGFHVLK